MKRCQGVARVLGSATLVDKGCSVTELSQILKFDRY